MPGPGSAEPIVYELDRLVKGKPKSEASVRKVVLPELIVPELVRHLDVRRTRTGRLRIRRSQRGTAAPQQFLQAVGSGRSQGRSPDRHACPRSAAYREHA
jgi:hypothetical protein